MQLDIDGIVDDQMASEIKQDIRKAGSQAITVLINSPGGSVFSGLSIYDSLARHRGHVSIVISGLAASIASIIAMSGDTISIGEASQMMVHRPWSAAIGYADELRAEADMLDRIEDSLVGIYASRSGQSEARIRSWVKAETWFTGKAAVEAGLADTVIPLKQRAAAVGKPAAMQLDRVALAGGLAQMRSAGLLQGQRMALAQPPNCKAPIPRPQAIWTAPKALKRPALRGYASVYKKVYVSDGDVMCVWPGAFDELLKSGVRCEAWIGHREGTAFASTTDGSLELAVDGHGLCFQATVPSLALLEHFRSLGDEYQLQCSPRWQFRYSTMTIEGQEVMVARQAIRLDEISVTPRPALDHTYCELIDAAEEWPLKRAAAAGHVHTGYIFRNLLRPMHELSRDLDALRTKLEAA